MRNNKKIIIIGMGQGGLVSAYYLGKAGFEVEVYETKEKGSVSYPWFDDITFNIFEKVGIPAPPRDAYTQKSKWLFVSPDEKNSLAVPPMPPMVEVSISRQGLNAHLCDLAESAGCILHYASPVSRLITKGNNVIGIECGGKEHLCDLVIDASGLYSPFRAQVPAKFKVQAKPACDDIMSGYRTFYKRNKKAKTPDPESTLYVKHKDGVGISWCNLNDRDEVDMLCLRVGGISESDYKEMVKSLFANHDILTNDVIMPTRPVNVGVRYTLSRMVANGYAAVGDSAFMTMPFMGSGIEASMQAGKMLAEVVIANGKKPLTAKHLWPYQVQFYKKLGALYMAIDVAKRWALNLDPALINWLFGCGAVTSEDMKLLSTDENNKASISAIQIVKKVLILLSKPSLILNLVKTLIKAVKSLLIALAIPRFYSEILINRWQKKYESVIH